MFTLWPLHSKCFCACLELYVLQLFICYPLVSPVFLHRPFPSSGILGVDHRNSFGFLSSSLSCPLHPLLSVPHFPCLYYTSLLRDIDATVTDHSSHMFNSDLILLFLRDSIHPRQHHNPIHLQPSFLSFHCCPCLCTIHQSVTTVLSISTSASRASFYINTTFHDTFLKNLIVIASLNSSTLNTSFMVNFITLNTNHFGSLHVFVQWSLSHFFLINQSFLQCLLWCKSE